LGKTVDAASFDAAEAAICFTYDDAVRLDSPQAYYNFRDMQLGGEPIGGLARDRSGYERHASRILRGTGNPTYAVPGPSGDPNDPYAALINGYFTIPFDVRAGFVSADCVVLEAWYYIDVAVSIGGLVYCIMEKRVGAAAKSGHFLSHQASLIRFGVNNNATFIDAALTSPADLQRWMHLVGVASGGVLALYKDGVLAVSGTYAGSLDRRPRRGAP
jgi:hypothetical protein